MNWFVGGFGPFVPVGLVTRRTGSIGTGFMMPDRQQVLGGVTKAYLSQFFFCQRRPVPLTLFGVCLGFPGPQASHNFSCEPPASSHVNRVNHRFRVRLGFPDLMPRCPTGV